MTKTFTSLIALTLVAAGSATATAGDTTTPTFDAAIQYDASAPVEDIYASIEKRSRTLCKRQIRSVKSLSVRHEYLTNCTSELVASAVKRIDMEALQRYYAQKQNKPVLEKFAQMTR